MTELVERLLDVSRIVRGGLTMNLEDADLAQIVRQVADDFRDPAAQAGSAIGAKRRFGRERPLPPGH